MTVETTLLELRAQVAELAETVAGLSARVAANGEIATQVRELLAVLKDQKHQTTVQVPPAPPPLVTVQGNTGDFEVVHEWMGSRIVRSVVTRKGGGLLS